MDGIQAIGKMVIILGVVFLLAGSLMYFGGRLGVGRIPGDIVYRKGSFTFYFPLATSIIISIILTLIMALFRFRR